MTNRPSHAKRKTAGELIGQLSQDPAYLARRAEQEAMLEERVRRYREASAPVLAELQELGYQVDRVGDLVAAGVHYESAVPVLVEWLPKVQEASVQEDIVRTLAVPWATSAARMLVGQFRRLEIEPGVRWAIGNALSIVADDSLFDDVVALARDRRYGRTREMIVVALGNMKNTRAVDVLIELLADDEVAGHAVIALGKLKDRKARVAVAALQNHPKAWVRGEVKKTLARMDR